MDLELTLFLRDARGREVIRASTDGFHFPRAQRYRRGRYSPEGEVVAAACCRYLPSQQRYFATARPTDHADIIVYNDEPQRPAWEVRSHRSRRDPPPR